MDRQEAIDVATVRIQVTVRLLLKGTGFGAAAASRSLPLRHELIRRPIADE